MTWKMTTSMLTPAVALAIAISGCADQQDQSETATTASETTTSALTSEIHGIACGLSYNPGINSQCDNVSTTTWNPPQDWPWDRQVDGDLGASKGLGFYHQSWHRNDVSAPDMLVLPAGTTCGLKEGCVNTTETCFGFDTQVQCPPGWQRRHANDASAPSGCGFVWCEYLDPHFLCLGGSCLGNMPKGLTCGVTDGDNYRDGICMGLNVASNGCPSGFFMRGPRDAGRPAGHGIKWCEKM